MVSFSCYQKADYSELINNHLKGIPIESIDDFLVVSNSLESLLNKKIAIWIDNDDLRERIESIREIIDNPENYVQNESLFPELRRLIKGKIRDRIDEFAAFTFEEKQSYISEKKLLRDKAKENQQMVKALEEKHKNREPSVLSDQAWLQLMQDRFNQEIGGVNLNNFDEGTRDLLLNYRERVELLLSTGVSLPAIINHPECDLIIFQARELVRCINLGITWPMIMELPRDLCHLVLYDAGQIADLIEHTDVTWPSIMGLPEDLQREVIKNIGIVRRFNRKGYTWHDIRKMFYYSYRIKQAVRDVFDFIAQGIFTG